MRTPLWPAVALLVPLLAGCAAPGPSAADLALQACQATGFGLDDSDSDDNDPLLTTLRAAQPEVDEAIKLASQAAAKDATYTDLVRDFTRMESMFEDAIRMIEDNGEFDDFDNDWTQEEVDEFGKLVDLSNDLDADLNTACSIEVAR